MGRHVSRFWIGLLELAAILIGMIAAGCFDPAPLGRIRVEISLPELTIPSHSQTTTPITTTKITTSTIQAAARIEGSGAWALHLNQQTRIEIDSAGYAGLYLGEDALVPLVPFPHLRPDWNTIRADILERQLVAIRLNGEFFWQGSLPFEEEEEELQFALSGRSFDQPIRLVSRPVLLFLPDPQQAESPT